MHIHFIRASALDVTPSALAHGSTRCLADRRCCHQGIQHCIGAESGGYRRTFAIPDGDLWGESCSAAGVTTQGTKRRVFATADSTPTYLRQEAEGLFRGLGALYQGSDWGRPSEYQ